MQFLIWLVGVLFFIWAFSDPRFRDAEGFIDGAFCLPISIGLALLIFGLGFAGRFRKTAFWLMLVLIGQAVALQMIEAGPYVRYQHYKPFYRLFTEIHPVILIYFVVQTGLVSAGLKTRWPKIKDWFSFNFKGWRLLGMGLIFFLCSATVSRDVSAYVLELFFATFVQAVNLGNIVLMAWAFPEEVLASWRQRLDKIFDNPGGEETNKSASVDRFVLLAGIWVTVVAVSLNFFVYENHPHIQDEVVHLYHAKYLASGMLSTPAPPVPEAFEMFLIRVDRGRWYSVQTVGWSAMLALGVLLGVPWLINPILAGLNIVLTYILLQEIYSRHIARSSLFLLCVSPWYVFMGMNFMPHMFTLTCALVGALAIARAIRSPKIIWGWIGGIATGIASLTRPLDGLIMSGLLGLWSIGIGGRRLKVSGIVGFILGAIIVGSIVLPYNKYFTGDPAVFPIMAYTDEKFGPKSNALGFGPERGMGWPIDPFPGHSPIDAMVNANLNTSSINIELFGWGTGSLILVIFLAFSGRIKKEDFGMLAIISAVFIAYFFNYFSGGPDFGARYWFLMLIPLVVLTVRGTDILEKKLKNRMANPSFTSVRVKVGVMSLCLLTLVNFFPWRAIDKYHHYRGMKPDIRYLAKKYDFGRSLVLIKGNHQDYASAFTYNPVDLQNASPIYAWDQNAQVRTRVLKAFSDRLVWIVNGPSVTHGRYEVIEGPISPLVLMAKENDMQ